MKKRKHSYSDNWKTPDYFYNYLNKEFDFNFDPCPFTLGTITPDRDGLLIPWLDRNWINPPYNRKDKEAFINRAYNESLTGKLCVMLLPASTSTKIFHEVIMKHANEIRFVKGRISFLNISHDGKFIKTDTGMHDSMIVVFDGRIEFKGCKITSFDVPKENLESDKFYQFSLFDFL